MSEGLPGLVAVWAAQAPQLIGPIYPWVSAGHILALGLLVGSVTILDLRLLGLFRGIPLRETLPVLVRLAGTGLAAAVLTGLLLFSVQPSHYLDNSAFLLKLALVAAGVINVLVMHRLPGWRRALSGAEPDGSARVSAALSLLIWIGAVFAGRWIAFL